MDQVAIQNVLKGLATMSRVLPKAKAIKLALLLQLFLCHEANILSFCKTQCVLKDNKKQIIWQIKVPF